MDMIEFHFRGQMMGKDFEKRKLGSDFLDSIESSKILKIPSDFNLEENGIFFLFYVITYATTINDTSCAIREGVARLQFFQEKNAILEKEDSIWTHSPFIIDFSKNIKTSRKKSSKKQRYQVSYSLRDCWTEKNSISSVEKKICKSVQEIPNCGVIRGEESFWEASLLRLCMQVSGSIFGSKNKLQEIFSSYPQTILKKYKIFSQNIEKILQQKCLSGHLLQELGNILVETGLFKKYEDRFLDLVQNKAISQKI